MSATDHTPSHAASPMMQISNDVVRLYKDQFGRGPTTARAVWAGDDMVAVTLENTLTPAERNLVRLGENERLRETRMFFQYAMVREFCEPVERATGRTVRAFISGVDTLVDGLATELFVLHPVGYEGPSRADLGDAADGLGGARTVPTALP
jgi:uncharacterized protein YbcI